MDDEPVIRLLSVPGCPLVDQVRAAVRDRLRECGLDVPVEEVVGDFPSPTLVVDGVDVATGRAPAAGAYCRLDLPTNERIAAAIRPRS